MSNLTPRDRYLLRQACELTETPSDATRNELAKALLEATEILEALDTPPQSNIDDMRTLLREAFLGECLSELSAQERRQHIRLID